MSGQLVGEVLAAAAFLRSQGVPKRGFDALLAIAEKARTDNRQASVRWEHIQAALYERASLSTAKRAVADLRTAGVIRVVRRGFDNQNGHACAPIYEIASLKDLGSANNTTPTERLTQMTRSVNGRTAHPDDPFDQERIARPDDPFGQGRTDQIRDRTDHPGDPLDGSIDGKEGGSPNSGTSPAAPSRSTPPTKFTANGKRPRCANHAHIAKDADVPKCVHCMNLRLAAEAAEQAERQRNADDYARIRDCPDCDGHHWLLGADRTPLTPPVRCDHRKVLQLR